MKKGPKALSLSYCTRYARSIFIYYLLAFGLRGAFGLAVFLAAGFLAGAGATTGAGATSTTGAGATGASTLYSATGASTTSFLPKRLFKNLIMINLLVDYL